MYRLGCPHCSRPINPDPEMVRKRSYIDWTVLPFVNFVDQDWLTKYVHSFYKLKELAHQRIILKDQITKTQCGCSTCGEWFCLQCSQANNMECFTCESNLVRGYTFSPTKDWRLPKRIREADQADRLMVLEELKKEWESRPNWPTLGYAKEAAQKRSDIEQYYRYYKKIIHGKFNGYWCGYSHKVNGVVISFKLE